MDLTDEQWATLEPLIPQEELISKRKRDRPWRNPCALLNGALRILRTGIHWQDLPDRYRPYQTCHGRYQRWVRMGVMESILRALAEDPRECGDLDLEECFIDGAFVVARKGGLKRERPSGAKVRRSWQWQTTLVFLAPYASRVLACMK